MSTLRELEKHRKGQGRRGWEARRTSCGNRTTKTLPNLSAPASVLRSMTHALVSQRGAASSANIVSVFSVRLYLTNRNDSARSPTTMRLADSTWIDCAIVLFRACVGASAVSSRFRLESASSPSV